LSVTAGATKEGATSWGGFQKISHCAGEETPQKRESAGMKLSDWNIGGGDRGGIRGDQKKTDSLHRRPNWSKLLHKQRTTKSTNVSVQLFKKLTNKKK